jgi:murein DD-endopeptidase MepM/ murein hydrolase activator NlpD
MSTAGEHKRIAPEWEKVPIIVLMTMEQPLRERRQGLPSVVLVLLVLMMSFLSQLARAQGTNPCGVVDAIDYPIDGVSIENDDFGMYRAGFNGRHTGIDMAFARYGDPVRAAARGRVTFSDPAGWDTEKGVVIIEHVFPDDSIYFTLYGHMEEVNGRTFPKVGDCVERGQIIGSVGHPSRGAPHLHYEIRTKDAATGGPGYWYADPLDGGWLHPIDFTEQWRVRLNPAFRMIVTAGAGPTAPPLWNSDGTVTFAEQYHLERRDDHGDTLWRLDAQGLDGVVNLPDGRLLGRTTDDQIIIVDGANARFAASWKADRPLRSPPIRIGDSIVFVSDDNRVVSYDAAGKLTWQTDQLGTHIERYAQSGNHLAVSAGQDKGFKLWVIDPTGATVYQATAASPIIPVPTSNGGFIVMTGSQVGLLNADMALKPLMDVGQALNRDSQIAIDPAGNVVLYPGKGQTIYGYAANGGLRWQSKLPTPQLLTPLVGVGSGCLAYVLTYDGGLLVYRASDGALRGLATLYAGGVQGHPAARFLNVSPDDQVQFSAGYLSIATIDGPTLANDCKRSS